MDEPFKSMLVGNISGKRIVRSMILVPIVAAIGFILIAIFFSDRLIFMPPPSSYKDEAKAVKIEVSDTETISAQFFENSQARYTVLFSHGNAEDIGHIEPFVQRLRELGLNVLVYDYRGYGTSGGSASEANAYSDIDAAYRYLVDKKKTRPENIILQGRSLGGAISVDLASREPVGGLIIESTFTSAFRVITRYPILPFDKFKSIEKIKRVNCPTLVIHGTEDSTIPLYHGEELFEAANEPKYSNWVEGAEHNNVYDRDKNGYLDSISKFIATLPAD
ncbi:MAG TPA: alpha/beta hydrolase [Pyrinomonadaceae bacterium]|nr:alpha/beta hydrolase [Pyrinomonadaceae bacterium]